jgi:hypothetical protein
MVPLLLARSRHRSGPLAVVAGGLGIYAVFAIGYQHLLKPSVNHSVPQPAAQLYALPAAAPTAPAAAEPGTPAAPAPRAQTSTEHMRFVSGVAAPARDAGEKTSPAESKKTAKRRESSGREHRSSREVAFRPFPFFRPFF